MPSPALHTQLLKAKLGSTRYPIARKYAVFSQEVNRERPEAARSFTSRGNKRSRFLSRCCDDWQLRSAAQDTRSVDAGLFCLSNRERVCNQACFGGKGSVRLLTRGAAQPLAGLALHRAFW